MLLALLKSPSAKLASLVDEIELARSIARLARGCVVEAASLSSTPCRDSSAATLLRTEGRTTVLRRTGGASDVRRRSPTERAEVKFGDLTFLGADWGAVAAAEVETR